MVRVMKYTDARYVLEIYRFGLETRNATFETSVPDWNKWDSRHLPHSRFVFERDGFILGWAALSPVSGRAAYKGVAELSIYTDTQYLGQGIGSELMKEIIRSSEENGIWTLFSSVFPENIATLKLHDKFGFRVIGKRERIAQLDGIWRDTLMLERRSRVCGI
jgi:L-amino acid N-acyltransferase YncA